MRGERLNDGLPAVAGTGRFTEQDVNLRWIYVHMIE